MGTGDYMDLYPGLTLMVGHEGISLPSLCECYHNICYSPEESEPPLQYVGITSCSIANMSQQSLECVDRLHTVDSVQPYDC